MAVAWPKKRFLNALLFGVCSGLLAALAVLSPWGQQAEERFGLAWLFHLRGPVEPPAQVVIVAVDKESSDRLGVPYDTTRWPRDIHARLLDGLSAAGARVVTFDLLFRQPRTSEDGVFADAIERAGKVALLEFLAKDQPAAVSHGDQLIPVTLQQRVLPTERLAQAAAASAPFTLPKVPERVSRFWTFDHNAGDAMSLPAVALMLYAQDDYATLRETLAAAMPASADLASDLVAVTVDHSRREVAESLGALLRRQASASKSPGRQRTDALPAVLDVLRAKPGRYFNFYGPPQTLATVSYADALGLVSDASGAGGRRFAGKAVFVGVSSPVQWQHQDEFLTVYSDRVSGLDLSGTEILATGFANLLDRTTIRFPAPGVVLLGMLFWGVLLGVPFMLLRPVQTVLFAASATAAYLYVAHRLFTSEYLWSPLFVPLLLLLPTMLLLAVLVQHRRARADLSRIRDTFGHYLPRPMVDRLVQEGFQPLQDRRTVFGVCLITDAQGYTSVAERISSEQLVDLVNDYLDVVISPIRRHGGEVSDIKGDSVLALWASRQDDLAIRNAACRAITDIAQAVAEWNASNPYDAQLPTRIGLHCGTMTLASVGAADHYEQRAVGDIVNTASRLEQLSKELGTHLLLSEKALEDIDQAVTRYVGSFVLKGRTKPLRVCELLGWSEPVRADYANWAEPFARGVSAFERKQWDEAEAAFDAVLTLRDRDPVANWYRKRIDSARVA